MEKGIKYSRKVAIVLGLLFGVPLTPFVLVFDGGPKSHGDELIVRTSRFFAEPENEEKGEEE